MACRVSARAVGPVIVGDRQLQASLTSFASAGPDHGQIGTARKARPGVPPADASGHLRRAQCYRA